MDIHGHFWVFAEATACTRGTVRTTAVMTTDFLGCPRMHYHCDDRLYDRRDVKANRGRFRGLPRKANGDFVTCLEGPYILCADCTPRSAP